MTRIANSIDDPDKRGRIPHGIAMALLLATLVGRAALPEMPFRTSPFIGLDSGSGTLLRPNHIDLASMTFGAAVFLAGVLWFAGEARRRRLHIRAGWLGVMIAIFAVWSLVSALRAGDRRGALVFWTNQVGLMFAGWLAIQLCARPKHRAVLLAVLAAMGVMLAMVGLRQVFIDAPQRIADFEARSAEILTARRWSPDSPEAIAFKERLFKSVPLGFFSLANVFASLMIVLTAALAGLVIDRWRKVLPARKANARLRKRGEIHLPTLSAVVMTAGPPLCIVALVLAVSRGATAAAAAAGLAAAVVLRFRAHLAAHWRRWMLVTVLLIGVGSAGVIAHGLKHDSLIVKTMTFRWYYWTAGAQIAADEPLWGAGPGGFGSAYEAYRRPAGEEAVKTPHNFIIHAAAQYGLVGALWYLGVVGMVLWGLFRPMDNYPEHLDPARRSDRSSIAMIVWIPLILVVCQCVFGGARGQGGGLVFGSVETAVILAIALAMILWWGPVFSAAAAEGREVTRVVLACGLGAFVAHNTVSFSLWMPGAAAAFWLGSGAVMSFRSATPLNITPLRWSAVSAAAIGTLAIIVLLWLPVARRSWATEMVVDSLIARDGEAALVWARRAAHYDSLDPIAAADIARLLHETGRKSDLEEARLWAIEAIRRCPQNSSNHRLAAGVLLSTEGKLAEAIKHMENAVQRDPQSLNMRIEFAEMLLSAGMGLRAGEQLKTAERIHNALPDDSIFRLRAEALAELQALKARADDMER
ncbi:MAG: O-antigen ligase family protein [Phycisphaerae bacterium]|jgi:O-antigen ligase|nr:O-antigen ligase family protein [Phycisphaerae bacterium]